jgi:DNA polymerase-3 subunit epsilon
MRIVGGLLARMRSPAVGRELEAAARELERSEEYRVLRRLRPKQRLREGAPKSDRLARGVVLDVETTGCDLAKDRIVELALVSFTFDREEGVPYEVLSRYRSLEDPGIPIDPAATRVHGITDKMVKGTLLDDRKIEALLSGAEIVIAHHAGFDREFCERRHGLFRQLPWACSGTQIAWSKEGIASTKLEYLASRAGFFYDAHRAEDDCAALLEVLSNPLLPVSGVTPLKALLETYRKTELRVWALEASADKALHLITRGYVWSEGRNGQERGWYRVIEETKLQAELIWLRDFVLPPGERVFIDTIDAYSRFSTRRGDTKTAHVPYFR